MSFFQRWIRPFFKRQGDAPLDSNKNITEFVEAKVKVEDDDSDSESVTFLWETTVSKDDASLRTDLNIEDDAYFQDSADLNFDSTPDNGTNLPADTAQHDSVLNDLRFSSKGDVSPYPANVLSIDNQKTHKSKMERRCFDSLFSDSRPSSEGETGRKVEDDDNAVNPTLPSPAPSTENGSTTPLCTSQPLTPTSSSVSISADVMNLSPTAATNEVPANESTAKPTALSVNQLLFDQAQVANQPRLPWNWSHAGTKTKEHYEPTTVGKWWWVWAQENRERLPVISNLGRIMETELGEQRFGENRCKRCQIEDLECWVYSQRAIYQVCNPGSACTRCRTEPRNMGCSLSKRTPKKRKMRPPTPPAPRLLLPKTGYGVYQYPPVNMGPGAPAVQAGNPIHASNDT